MVVRIGQGRENFSETGTVLRRAEDDCLRKALIITLRIDDTQLVTLLAETFQQTGGERGFPTAEVPASKRFVGRDVTSLLLRSAAVPEGCGAEIPSVRLSRGRSPPGR